MASLVTPIENLSGLARVLCFLAGEEYTNNYKQGGKAMKCECNGNCDCGRHKKGMDSSSGQLGFFGVLAYIGAAIYFVGQSGGAFWAVVLALLKAIIWPVYLIYNVLRVLGAA